MILVNNLGCVLLDPSWIAAGLVLRVLKTFNLEPMLEGERPWFWTNSQQPMYVRSGTCCAALFLYLMFNKSHFNFMHYSICCNCLFFLSLCYSWLTDGIGTYEGRLGRWINPIWDIQRFWVRKRDTHCNNSRNEFTRTCNWDFFKIRNQRRFARAFLSYPGYGYLTSVGIAS